MLEHVGTVVVEVGALFTRELTNANARMDAPRIEELVSDLGNDDQLLIARKSDVPLVEQVINVW